MPYIDKASRDRLTKTGEPQTAGELNYALTLVCKDYFDRMGQRYQQINDIIGALEACKLEYYRRVAVPYEDGKAEANGDVYL